MLKIFNEFRSILDDVMLKAFGHRIVLWGYDHLTLNGDKVYPSVKYKPCVCFLSSVCWDR